MNNLRGRAVSQVGKEAMALLLGHDYPGNIRELENIIEHAFVLCHDGEIWVDHLPAYLLSHKKNQIADRTPMATNLRTTEEEIIVEALRQHGYNRLAAAKALGIHKSTLFRKLKKYNIILPQIDGRKGRKESH